MNLSLFALIVAISSCGYSSSVPSFILPFTDCVQSRGKDGFYRGAIDVTESGARCMNWTEVAGFQERYPGKGIGEHNHCRNPDGRIRPWCFFKNHRGRVDWGYCDCKQGRARAVSLFRPGMAKIHWRAVHCRGEEPDLLHCPKTTWNGGECSLVAAVTCTPQQVVSLPIRLVGGQSGGVAKAWGQAHFGKGSGRVWLDEVRCTGNELTLEQCPKSAWGEHNCLHAEDAGVSCKPLTDGSVRLVGGTGSYEGRLEVFYRGINTTLVPRFGVGSGPILLDDVSCTGKEPSLLLCNRREWLRHDCTHHEDVSISCSPERNGESLPTSLPWCGESPHDGILRGRDRTYTRGQHPVNSVCGLRLIHTRQRRIIGGENSLRGGWPWQAAIRLRGSRGDGRLVCGATLIDSCWVLTSAHCFKRYGNSTKQYKVRVGDYHSLVPEEYEEEYGVDQIVLHPSYHSHSNDYDLALVRLSPGAVGQMPGECVSFSRHVLPACLPMRKERVLKQASNCHITGWGDTGAFTSRMLCAGSVHSERRVDSCRGDSGGPLVCERPGGGWVVYGVTSWGHACRTQQSPGVYTKVSAFSSWIGKVIGQDEKKREEKRREEKRREEKRREEEEEKRRGYGIHQDQFVEPVAQPLAKQYPLHAVIQSHVLYHGGLEA
ncbi:hypothetical protein INR49_014384 [Caranx melampygus]|nr:hypothetical protein INR49_014384 [Caranx melampygus]